jgi:hypothetical protein
MFAVLDYFLCALLILWGCAGWKRAFDAERHAKTEVEFYRKLPRQWMKEKA